MLVLALVSSNAWIWEWIWSRWRRMILYMVAWHMMEMIKQMNMFVGIKAKKICLSQNWVLTSNAQTAQMTTLIRVTLEDVTMLGYCSGLTMAMSLSMLIPAIIISEVAQRLIPTVVYASIITCFRFSDCEYKLMKLLTIKKWLCDQTNQEICGR